MNKILKAILPIILTLVLLFIGCSAGSKPSGETSPTAPIEGTQIGNIAPTFQLQDLNGQTVSLGDLMGKPVLLNFWATWCPPCRSEMPLLQEIYEGWSDKGLVLLAIDIGEHPTQVRKFLETHNLSIPVLLDTNGEVAQKYNIIPIPTTFFIDKDGIIQEKVIGAFRNKEQIEGHLIKIVPQL
ncbi:redoxin domain-containing protein [Chloroflexota bacterium]